VEGISNRKDEGLSEEDGKQPVEKGALWKAGRNLMGRGVNRENVWEEDEGLAIRELGRRMVTEARLMGEEALVKEGRVTRRKSTTLVWVSKNRIALELSQIQPFSSDFDTANPVWADQAL